MKKPLLAAFSVLFLLSCLGCPNNTPVGTTTTTTLAPTPLQVEAELKRSIDPVGNSSTVDWYFSIKYNGAVVDTATIMVNSTPVPVRHAFAAYYTLDQSEGATYVPGATYTISVMYNGSTYVETMVAPGDIAINSDHTRVSWNYGGDFSVISANHTFGSGTYQMPGSFGPLSSPHAIPPSAYPQAGQSYDLNVNIGSYKSSFGSLHGNETHVWMFDYTRRRFTKN